MRIIRGFSSPITLRHAVATMGSYDGVHCGHRILLDEVVARARLIGGESVVLTFEPHPRITLHNDEGLRLLSTLDEKLLLLEKLGIDCVVVIPFDKAFSHLSREEFLTEYIVGRLGIEELVVGYNHRFGYGKEGDSNYLSSSGRLRVREMAQQRVNGEKVSSSVIRKTIEGGDMQTAARLLGHPYIIIGSVDVEGCVTTDHYKLLPPEGRYPATANGKSIVARVDKEGRLHC